MRICSLGKIGTRTPYEGNEKFPGFTETFFAGPYALAASPARYAVERADWKGAAD